MDGPRDTFSTGTQRAVVLCFFGFVAIIPCSFLVYIGCVRVQPHQRCLFIATVWWLLLLGLCTWVLCCYKQFRDYIRNRRQWKRLKEAEAEMAPYF